MSDMETDRPLEIGNLRKKCAWGAFFPQIANRPCSVCHGVLAPLSANPAFGPAENKKGGSVLLPEGSRLLGMWPRILGATGFWVSGFEIVGVWHEMLGVWQDLLVVWQAMLGVWHEMLGAWYAILGV